MREITIEFAEKCAWRAAYLFVDGRQVAHIGVDPNHGVRPRLFVMVGGGRSHNFLLPRVPWKQDASLLYLHAYRLSASFWHNVDGRYGWGVKR